MSILEELYDGNINPSQMFIKNGSEYKTLCAQLSEYTSELTSLLSSEEKQLFEKIWNKNADLTYLSEKERFMEGFRIGANIMWEITNAKSKNFESE